MLMAMHCLSGLLAAFLQRIIVIIRSFQQHQPVMKRVLVPTASSELDLLQVQQVGSTSQRINVVLIIIIIYRFITSIEV